MIVEVSIVPMGYVQMKSVSEPIVNVGVPTLQDLTVAIARTTKLTLG